MAADLLVLGAGPAGSGAAYRAASSGREVVVVERSARPGGAAGSTTVGGQSVDFGSHRLHPSIRPDILEELQRLLGDELQRRLRRGRIRLAGRWVRFPLSPLDAARNLPPSFLARAGRDALTKPFRRSGDATFAGQLRAGLGPAMCDAFYFPYARKVWGREPEHLSAEQARRRVSAGSPGRLIGKVVTGRGSYFWYPAGGYGRISEALVEGARNRGAQVRLGTSVERLTLRADGVTAHLDDGSIVEARRVWSTVPITALARMCAPEPPEEVLRAAASLRFRAMILVYLVLDTGRFSEYDAHYFPEETTPVTRVSEPKNYRDGNDPPGRTVLCAEIPCGRGDAHWEAPLEDLTRIAVNTLEDAGLVPPSLLESAIHRVPFAYPVYETGFERALEPLMSWIDEQPRLLTFGRQGLFVHDNAHHALAMAWDAVDCLDESGGFDVVRWQAAQERFRSHVVED